jgi:hypothetical protein
MAKASGTVLKSKPNLLFLPVISGIALCVLTATLAVPVLFGAAAGYGLGLSDNAMAALGGAALFLWYFLCTFVIVFCNAALVSCALQRFNGTDPSIGSGLAAAGTRLPQILGWSLLAASVGLLLRGLQALLSKKFGFIGDLVQGMGDAIWGVATYFVLPVVVTEGLGPIKAVQRSSSILRRTWGESLGGSTGLGAVMLLFLLPLAGFGALLATGAGGPTAISVAGVISLLYALAVTVVFTTLGTIFRAAVYSYAVTEQAPPDVDADLIRSVFYNR